MPIFEAHLMQIIEEDFEGFFYPPTKIFRDLGYGNDTKSNFFLPTDPIFEAFGYGNHTIFEWCP